MENNRRPSSPAQDASPRDDKRAKTTTTTTTPPPMATGAVVEVPQATADHGQQEQREQQPPADTDADTPGAQQDSTAASGTATAARRVRFDATTRVRHVPSAVGAPVDLMRACEHLKKADRAIRRAERHMMQLFDAIMTEMVTDNAFGIDTNIGGESGSESGGESSSDEFGRLRGE